MTKSKKLVIACIIIVLLAAGLWVLFNNWIAPSGKDAAAVTDYSVSSGWAYFGLGEDKEADLFLICPTVDMNDEFNMSMDDMKTRADFLGALNMERGIYEDSTRMYAPYYRQAAMKVYSLDSSEQEQYMEIAYSDISAAFRYYLDNENNGRPIVLAGFSQGADMCYRLLQEYFGDEALYDQLVAVYAIGWPMDEKMTAEYPQIRPAQSAADIGTVISFDCEAPEVEETFISPAGQRAYTINPLNWRTDGTPASKEENPGACFTDYDGVITLEAEGLCGCYINEDRGVLKVTDIDQADYPAIIPGLPEGAYHIYDYQFFFRSLQENVATRLDAFLGKEAADKIQEIKDRGVLLVGATGDYRPMSFLDSETGEYWGFDTELAKDLAAELSVDIEFVPTTWPTLMDDTLAGKFDLAITGITITDARKEQALMSDGYLGNGKTVLCRAEDADKYTSIEAIDRPEVTVMENPGGLNEKFARENLPKANIVIHDVNEEIPGLVADGKADVMITEILEAGYYVGQDDRLAAPLIYEPFTNGQLGVLMPKGSEDLLDFVNSFIKKEKTKGRIDSLAEEYIYKYIDDEADNAA